MESPPKPHESLPVDREVARDLQSEHQYRILSSPELQLKYLSLTDALVAKMAKMETDVAIFLDKSARPVAWLLKELWPILAPVNPQTGKQLSIPQIKFLNIDREQWGAVIGRSEDKEGGIDINRLPPERLNELQRLYAPVAGLSDEADNSLLTGKKVMVVDEVRMSGDTLEMSQKILQKAFPDAEEIVGVYWMSGNVRRDPRSGAMVGQDLPVWYSDTVVTGRLVGNRDTTKSLDSNSTRQKTGRYWLSAPFRVPDQEGRRLKREIRWLAEDLQDHKLIYIPALEWDITNIDPIDERVERINGLSLRQFAEVRQSSNSAEDLIRNYRALIALNAADKA